VLLDTNKRYAAEDNCERCRNKVEERDKYWSDRLEQIKQGYEDEIRVKRQDWDARLDKDKTALQSELEELAEEFIELQEKKDSEIFALKIDYEDKLQAVQAESNETIRRLERELAYASKGAGVPTGVRQGTNNPVAISGPPGGVEPFAVSQGPDDFVENGDPSGYYTMIRKTIIENFKKFDFLNYPNDADYVRIEFELFSDGSLKDKPQFLGIADNRLKDALYQHFLKALPFPPFPKNISKKSQRFTIVISFKDE